jgi:hypothetical protein
MNISRYFTANPADLDCDCCERYQALVNRRYFVQILACERGDGQKYHLGEITLLPDDTVMEPKDMRHLNGISSHYRLPDEAACREFLTHVNSMWNFDPDLTSESAVAVRAR